VEISNSMFLYAESLALKVFISSQQLFSQHTIALQFNLSTTIMLTFFYKGSGNFNLTVYRLSNLKKSNFMELQDWNFIKFRVFA
jgi:hypothetical protein